MRFRTTTRRSRIRGALLVLPLVLTGLIAMPTAAHATDAAPDSTEDQLVIGGSVSDYGPWAVRMLVDGKPHCTGTAVTTRWIISASHCFFDTPEDPIADRRIEYRVGSLDMTKGTAVHPVRGSRVANPDGGDVMLIKVQPMKIRVARLSRLKVERGQPVRVFGWGATCEGDENSCQSNLLKQADLKVLNPKTERCFGFGTTDGTDFCLGKVHGIPAGGDSGGPVMTSTPDGKEKLVGVFWGSDRERTAGAASISSQITWIRKITKKYPHHT